MARKYSYKKRDLSVQCSKLKSSIIKKVKSGELEVKSITKTYVCNDLARRLKLSDGSSLFKANYQYKDYLDNWYFTLLESLEPYRFTESTKSTSNTDKTCSITDETPDDIVKLLKEKDNIIKHLNSIITTLRIENESLRLRRMGRIRRFDSTDDNNSILEESIDDIELTKLHNAINQLYNARFSTQKEE